MITNLINCKISSSPSLTKQPTRKKLLISSTLLIVVCRQLCLLSGHWEPSAAVLTQAPAAKQQRENNEKSRNQQNQANVARPTTFYAVPSTNHNLNLKPNLECIVAFVIIVAAQLFALEA